MTATAVLLPRRCNPSLLCLYMHDTPYHLLLLCRDSSDRGGNLGPMVLSYRLIRPRTVSTGLIWRSLSLSVH